MERKTAVRTDWETLDMPSQREKFILKRHFTDEEIKNLKYGNIPQEMEDKWFWYVENDILYAHRSWTGICIYMVEFDFKTDLHRVFVNNSKNEHACDSIEIESDRLNSLLNRWVQPRYDYYNEFIDETLQALQNDNNK